MKHIKFTCDNCGQTSFVESTYEYDGETVCHSCYQKKTEAYYNWDNAKNLAIQFMVEEQEVNVPLMDNLEKEEIYDDDYPNVLEAFQALKDIWEHESWGYGNTHVSGVKLIPVSDLNLKNPREIVECEEFDLWIYKELACESELYDRPFDETPETHYFCCVHAADCYEGSVYSKDFSYQPCDSCNRMVCVQNPSNGWHSQYHYETGECNKCYEERTLKEGINEDYNGESFPGQFYDEDDIRKHGWKLERENVQVGMGHFTTTGVEHAHELIRRLIDKDYKVLINIQSMAIGGLGGYLDVYTK